LQFEYRVRDVEINGATNDGIQIGADGTLTQEIFLTDLDIFTAAANGVHMFGAVSAVYCKNVSIGACNKGFLIGLPAVGQKVQSLFFTDCLADTCKDVGWHFADNGAATIADVNMTACWGSSNGTVTNAGGLLFDLSFASSKGFEVNGGRFINNKGYGIEILGGQKININNAQVLNNSQQGSGSSHGIIVGANVTDFSIIGGSSGLGTVGGVNNQGYGIVINGGTSNHYAIIGVDVTGNVTAGISDGGSGADKFIYGNAGFTTSNSGTAQIAAGTASIAVNHGLNATPATTDIQVTANSNITAATNFWVDTVGATSFTIRANVNVTGNSNFTWWARTKGA